MFDKWRICGYLDDGTITRDNEMGDPRELFEHIEFVEHASAPTISTGE